MSQIKPNTLLKVEELFNKKNWQINYGAENTSSLFYRFCERLKLLNDDQQLLVIELSYNYTRVELTSYLERLFDSLISLGDNIFNGYDKIFVHPLLRINQKTKSKTKSAGFIHYMFESSDYTWLSDKFIPNPAIDYLQDNFNNKNSILILVDDFVGSGETAIEICEEYLKIPMKNGNINFNNIKVISIAAYRQGINAIKEKLGIDVISAMIFEKGISDKYVGIEKSAKKSIMESIEVTLKVKNEFKFGFRQTEALITMLHKTPNNTFPVYWLETRNKVAPFPRAKNYKANG